MNLGKWNSLTWTKVPQRDSYPLPTIIPVRSFECTHNTENKSSYATPQDTSRMGCNQWQCEHHWLRLLSILQLLESYNRLVRHGTPLKPNNPEMATFNSKVIIQRQFWCLHLRCAKIYIDWIWMNIGFWMVLIGHLLQNLQLHDM